MFVILIMSNRIEMTTGYVFLIPVLIWNWMIR